MEKKENTLKITLSDEEMESISGGLSVTKEILVDGLAARVILVNSSVGSVSDGKNTPGGNESVFGPGQNGGFR